MSAMQKLVVTVLLTVAAIASIGYYSYRLVVQPSQTVPLEVTPPWRPGPGPPALPGPSRD
jgi:hypothetical protein